ALGFLTAVGIAYRFCPVMLHFSRIIERDQLRGDLAVRVRFDEAPYRFLNFGILLAVLRFQRADIGDEQFVCRWHRVGKASYSCATSRCQTTDSGACKSKNVFQRLSCSSLG